MIVPKITQKIVALAVSCVLGKCTKVEFEISKLLKKTTQSRKISIDPVKQKETIDSYRLKK